MRVVANRKFGHFCKVAKFLSLTNSLQKNNCKNLKIRFVFHPKSTAYFECYSLYTRPCYTILPVNLAKKENMNKICHLILLIFLSCKSQNRTITKEKINISKYKNYNLHPGVLDNPKSENHFYLHNNKEIKIHHDGKIILVAENTKDSCYKSQKLYSKKNLTLTREQNQFYSFCMGITKIYDENRKLFKTINCDEKYSFTINQLIKKLKKDYKIDFSTRKGNGKGIERIATNDYDTIPIYLAHDLNVQLNQRVSKIDYTNAKITVTHNGTTTETDYVLVTVPLGVLKANTIQFVPTLPATKQTAIQKVGVFCVNKFLLTWNIAFWDDVQYISYTTEIKDKFNYFVNVKKVNPNANALMTFAYAD